MKEIRTKYLNIVGPKGLVDSSDHYLWKRDWLDKYGEEPLCVVRPNSTDQVSQLLKLCTSSKIPVVPRGGNTGLVGGGVLGSPGGVIISMDRMKNISLPDVSSGVVQVEAGCILENLHSALEGSGYKFPMRLGSEGSAQIGGLVATNAGGSHAFRYGMMESLVIGLEVVLPDGQIWNGLRFVQKDNSGYQLRKLFCGSEGTLGIITKAILRLVPSSKHHCTALLAVKNTNSLIQIADQLKLDAGEFLSAIEFFSDTGLNMALDNISNLKCPLSIRGQFYLLIEAECSSSLVPLVDIISEFMEKGLNDGNLMDVVIATSENQRDSLWRLREEQPEGQRRIGYQLKHDISVPPGNFVEFLERGHRLCDDILKGVRINSFGHIGDGNIHFNLSPPDGQPDFKGLDDKFNLALSLLAADLKGSFSAEHGIGRSKIKLADELRGVVERDLIRTLKNSLDKNSTLNPGVITF